MKIYNLTCPKCLESDGILVAVDNPERLFCETCSEDVDLADVRQIVKGWVEYLADLDEFLREKKA